MEKQEFINKYNNVKESVIKALDEALTRAIGNEVIDFEKCEGNYLDVYPLIGAALQRELHRILEGGTVNTTKVVKRKASKYAQDYRVWHDYAGDYRTKKR